MLEAWIATSNATVEKLVHGLDKLRRTIICIAQTGPLSYMIVQSDGPDDPDHTGLWITDFAELVKSQGDVKYAYNLDGGSSVRVLFHGKAIDSPYPNTKSQKRSNADMIYFASAWQE